jgi:hypothetical protein
VSTFISSAVACVLLFMSQSDLAYAPTQAAGGPDNRSIKSTIECMDRPYAKDLPPPGPACEKELFARRGQPFTFSAHNGVAFGVSSEPDKPPTLCLWADNQTDNPVNLLICCGSTLAEHIDIFDSEGHRVLSKMDRAEQKARSEGREMVEGCTCSGWVSVPPHTIRLLDSTEISTWYSIQPGRYTISEQNPPAAYNLKPDEPGVALHAPPGLSLSIP